jgi:ribosome maturation factor RimP
MSRQLSVARVEEFAQSVGQKQNVEIVDVELKGTGRNQLLRVFIDKVGGVTHSDCENVSHSLSELLDGAALLLGEYTLEVSSPGVERKLKRREDYERFQGQKARIVVRDSEVARVGKSRFVEGTLAGVENDEIVLDVPGVEPIRIPLASIDRANLKFEW